jgi:large subunit ribosomal protein L25
MGNEKVTLKVQPRQVSGRAVKTLRREGIVPANIFGRNIESQSIQVSADEFGKAFAKAGETSIINLTIEGEKESRPVLISAVHTHSVTGQPLHVDFHEVDLTKKVTATIPVELVGEAPAESDLGAVIVQQLTEIDVEALPTDLPEKISIDITGLKAFDDSVTIADIKLDSEKITIDAARETVVVQAQEPQKEEEPEPVEAVEGEEATAEEGEKAEATEATPEGEAKSEE